MSVKPNLRTAIKPWYKKTWGILSIFLGLIAILVAAIFAIQVVTISQNLDLENLKTEGFTTQASLSDTPLGLVSRPELETVSDPHIGNPSASVVIVEFGDFECPFCKQAFPTIREMQTKYQDQVLFIWRDLPLRDIHPNAQKAAEAGECAHEQGKFWQYHDRLFINQARLTAEDLKNYAQQVGLNTEQFAACLDSGKYHSEVSADLQTALEAGAEGTPTFFINGQRISGVIPRDTFEQVITSLLSDN